MLMQFSRSTTLLLLSRSNRIYDFSDVLTELCKTRMVRILTHRGQLQYTKDNQNEVLMESIGHNLKT